MKVKKIRQAVMILMMFMAVTVGCIPAQAEENGDAVQADPFL